ncbi:MAG: type I methionyl aminopeptidase [Candidatus Omnitrophota bacterium]
MKKEQLIKIKTNDELQALRKSGKILASIREDIKRSLKPGIMTQEIDKKAEKLIRRAKAQSAFKGYRGYPACICTSINEEVVHGIPANRILKEGDILSIDIGIIVDQYYADTAFTIGIGPIDARWQRLIDVTKVSLDKGIAQAKAENHLSDISHAIQSFVESHGFSVVREFVGHGIGKALHEDPEIPNFGRPHQGPLLKEGMVLAIEPMVNAGSWQTKILNDGWTVVTQDGQPSAHFEHTVAVTGKGPEIFTQ